MYKVQIEKECTCFKRSNYKATQYFESEAEALEVATLMAKEMTRDFCKQHAFSVFREEDTFLILLMS